MNLELEYILTSEAGRRRKPEHQRGIQLFLTCRVSKMPQHCPPWFGHRSTGQFSANGDAGGSREPNDRDRGAPRRSGQGKNRVCAPGGVYGMLCQNKKSALVVTHRRPFRHLAATGPRRVAGPVYERHQG